MNRLSKVVTVWLTLESAEALRSRVRLSQEAESEWLGAERERIGISDKETPSPLWLRTRQLDLRPERWPREGHMLTRALTARLAMPDLAGPWPAFTDAERQALRLAGRRLGTPHERFAAKLTMEIPAEVAEAAHLAAERVSEEPRRALEAENLVGRGCRRSSAAVARLHELQDRIYTFGRISREGLDLIIP